MSDEGDQGELWEPGDLALCTYDSGCRPHIKSGERYIVQTVDGDADGFQELTLEGVSGSWLSFHFARSARASHIAGGHVPTPSVESGETDVPTDEPTTPSEMVPFTEGQEVWVKGEVTYVFGDGSISVNFAGAWDEANYYTGPAENIKAVEQ